jgi:hypothetical protein
MSAARSSSAQALNAFLSVVWHLEQPSPEHPGNGQPVPDPVLGQNLGDDADKQYPQ